jgi:sirohydrochlorin cobaltochelatase
MSKGLLAVSFGTAYAETRKKTIEAIEADLSAAFPERKLYTAWTSGMILRKLKRLGEETRDTLEEALARMEREGVTDLLVQPTFLQAGYEMRLVRETLEKWKGRFRRVCLGKVLADSPEDLNALARALEAGFAGIGENEVLALMGHGSEEARNDPYGSLAEAFRRDGRANFAVGTVEFHPGIEPVLELVKARRPDRVVLAPLMIVAGDHAVNDMAGDEPDSWKNRVSALGTETECVLKGLGEYPEVRALFAEHARNAEELSFFPEMAAFSPK